MRALETFRRVLYVLTTAGGKTEVAVEVIVRMLAMLPAGSRIVWLTHRTRLVQQVVDRLADLGIAVGIIASGTKPNPEARVQIASVFTARRRDIVGEVGLFIIDEAHRTPGGSYQAVLDAHPNALRLGLTATPTRLDGKPLADEYDEIVEGPLPEFLMAGGYISRPTIWSTGAAAWLATTREVGVDYDAKELARHMMSGSIGSDVVREYERNAMGMPAILFACTVEHGESFVPRFSDQRTNLSRSELCCRSHNLSYDNFPISLDIHISLRFLAAKNMKVGTFALAFDDLSVAALGFPIQVQRTYDNKDKRIGDFGVGWNLGVKNVRVEKSVSLGKFWYQQRDNSGFFTEYALIPQRNPFVTVTFPSGKSYKFAFKASPANSTLYPIISTDVVFDPIEGTVGQLYATNGSDLTVALQGFGYPGPVSLNTLDGNFFNPTRFTFVDEDGITYVINQKSGIEQITDLDGNTLSVGPNGLQHSCGKHVDFVRDAQGRITSIIDANGKSMAYSYDALGNLAAHTNREGEQQQYAYDDQHNLTAATDGRGITPANYSYDAAGRLVGVKDAYNNQTAFVHDTENNTDIVTDALGGRTTYRYDDDGNVVEKIDANGKTWLSTFDANDNMLSETDPLHNVKRHEYDALNNKTADVDALGNRTTYTWGNNRRITSMTDPLGRVTKDNWDFFWSRMQSHQDPIQVAAGLPGTVYTHAKGIWTVDTTIDALGHSSIVHLLEDGTMDYTQDAMGHVVSYTYDKNGNTLSKSEQRTKADLTKETLITSWEYDKQGRVTKTTYPDHSSTSTQYNKFGKPSKTIDQLLRETNYVYDSLGRLIETDFPDGYNEQTAYDANGRRGASTDKAGRITTYAYDKVGRLLRTTFVDGTDTETGYDDAGRVISQTNENLHATTFGYDKAGRRTSVKDALQHETVTAYDEAGQVLSVTDPLGHAMSYGYDLDGRQVRMTYADGTHADTQIRERI